MQAILPEPTFIGNRMISPAKGYAVVYPDGWDPQPNLLGGQSVTQDAFFAPQRIGAMKPNITVLRELADGASISLVVEEKVDVIARITGSSPSPWPLFVAHVPASALRYEISVGDGTTVEKEDVFLMNGLYVWTITLAVPKGYSRAFAPTFERFLGSFEFLP